MTLEEAITHAEQKAQELGACSCADEHRQLAQWLTLLSGLMACLGHGYEHTWGMTDRECIERCVEMIEECEATAKS